MGIQELFVLRLVRSRCHRRTDCGISHQLDIGWRPFATDVLYYLLHPRSFNKPVMKNTNSLPWYRFKTSDLFSIGGSAILRGWNTMLWLNDAILWTFDPTWPNKIWNIRISSWVNQKFTQSVELLLIPREKKSCDFKIISKTWFQGL